MKKIIPLESEIQKQIIDYLKLKHYFVMRLNSGSYAVNGGKSFVRGCEPGTPDLLAFKVLGKRIGQPDHIHVGLNLFFIEVKRPKGRVTELQEQKMIELEAYGAICLVIHSVDELQALNL